MTDREFNDYAARIACIDLRPQEAFLLRMELILLSYFEECIESGQQPQDVQLDASIPFASLIQSMLSAKVKPNRAKLDAQLRHLESTRKVNRRKLAERRAEIARKFDPPGLFAEHSDSNDE